MTFPCPNPIACPGTDQPLANLSSAAPDVPLFFGFHFNPWGPQICVTQSQELADICDPPPPFNPPIPILYSSNARSCTVDCHNGSSETFTAVTGTFVATTQVEADNLAFALACAAAEILCQGGTVTIFQNTPQSCTVNCPDQTVFTYTVEAGLVAGLSQGEANTAALQLACTIATFLCTGQPPTNIPDGGAGFPPMGGPLFANSAQSCSSTCPDGQSIYNFVVPAGLFIRENRAAANAVAASYACTKSTEAQACLSSIPTDLCNGEFYSQQIIETGLAEPVSWAIVGGALPPGMLFSGGFISGTPAATGTYNVTVRATGSDANFVERIYSLTVREILPDSLPDGDTSTPYAAALIGDGFSVPVWSVSSGALPTGLVLNPNTGVISGTPTAAGTFSFNVQASEGSATCNQNYQIEITSALTPAGWWTFEAGPPFIDAVAGNNISRSGGFGPDATLTPGKVNLAATAAVQLSDPAYRTAAASAAFGIAAGQDINILGWTMLQSSAGLTQFVTWLTPTLQFMQAAFQPGDMFSVNFGALTGATPPAGAFFFFRLHYNATTQKVGIAFNNGPVTYQAGNTVINPEATAFMGFAFDNLVTGANANKIDELCIFIGAMTQADVDAIYNGGAGRTFP